MTDLVYAQPLEVQSPAECSWYHTFDWPDGSIVRGRWDYRHNPMDALGRLSYSGASVLEIGPASGFLTLTMERAGAAVTCVDTSDEEAWQVVPRLDLDTEAFAQDRRLGQDRLRRGWWLSQRVLGGHARIAYVGASALVDVDPEIRFDVGVLSAVLLHIREPYVALSGVARRCSTIVVTETEWPGLVAGAHFEPSRKNKLMDTWWRLSPALLDQMLGTLGFEKRTEYRFAMRRYDLAEPDISRDTYTDLATFTVVYDRVE